MSTIVVRAGKKGREGWRDFLHMGEDVGLIHTREMRFNKLLLTKKKEQSSSKKWSNNRFSNF
jgi:hypothetical protein